MNKRILVVDDEKGIRQSLTGVLEDEGFEVQAMAAGEAALELLGREAFHLVLLDVWLKDLDGLEALRRIQQMERPPVVVMISGHGTIETAVKATKLGAFDFLEKPLSSEKTLLAVQNALTHQELAEENLRLRSEVASKYVIIGNSVPMKALRQQMTLMAPTNGRVLIYGESGTGKELVARAIHLQSTRTAQPFVEVTCAAIPEDSIESELFGAGDKVGKFQKADGGTLFLDEVGDMSLKTQAKVLRVLDEQRFEPVGSQAGVKVDARIIAATNKDLDEEIVKGNFREDLYYRLNVIPFYVPPLREHQEDIALLADHFQKEFSAVYGRRPKQFTEEALDVLRRYTWPGNVRELKNLIERIVIMNSQQRIERRHLPALVTRTASRARGNFSSLQEARAAYERDFILKKLEENQGNVSRTAEVLGMERSHLYRKMKSLGIAVRE